MNLIKTWQSSLKISRYFLVLLSSIKTFLWYDRNSFCYIVQSIHSRQIKCTFLDFVIRFTKNLKDLGLLCSKFEL